MSKIKSFLLGSILNPFFRKLDDRTWIFSSSNNNSYNSNSKYLFEYVLRERKDVSPLFVINDKSKRDELILKYGDYFIDSNSLSGILKILRARVWLTSAGLPVYGISLSKRRFIINLWHGIPLKKISLLENNLSWKTKKYFKFVFSNNYTHIVTTSDSLIDLMAKSFGVSEDIVRVWGQPRNDLLFKLNSHDTLSNLYEELPDFTTAILYAPTFRDNEITKLFPFEDITMTDFDEYLKENNIIIFIRTHPFENGKHKFKSDRILFINDDKMSDVMEVINQFDILITDYSSIYMDYMILNRPIIFLPYDLDKYEAERGLNFNYDSVTPGRKIFTYSDFKSALNDILENKLYDSNEYGKINNFFNFHKSPVSEAIFNNIVNEIELKNLEREGIK